MTSALILSSNSIQHMSKIVFSNCLDEVQKKKSMNNLVDH